jgi:uncharacterized protein (UPF0276 family)
MARSAAEIEATGSSIPVRVGIGLRFPHHRAVSEQRPAIGWFEVHPENYFGGGSPLAYLEHVRHEYPLSFHGVGLSLGSAMGISRHHCERLQALVTRFEPGLVSEHLSWSVVGGHYVADLLPLPMTEEALAVVCRNVDAVQTCLRRRILVENPSSYLRYRHSTMPEWEFLAAVARQTGCGVLCDVNNIYVSAGNHGWAPATYFAALDPVSIGEVHIAGHSTRDLENGVLLRIDDHGSRVCPEVWTLYAEALARFGPVPTLVEWDTNVPPLDTLLDEAAKAEALLDRVPGRACDAVAS